MVLRPLSVTQLSDGMLHSTIALDNQFAETRVVGQGMLERPAWTWVGR